MIEDHNLKIPEQDYRDLPLPSYSMLAAISKQGVDVIQGDKASFDLKFGSLVDHLCFEPHKVKDIYYQGASPKPPTKNVKDICDIVLEKITEKPGQTQEIESALGRRKQAKITNKLVDYKDTIKAAAASLGIYKNYDENKLMSAVIGPGQEYFKDRLEARGKVLIKPEMWALANQAAVTLQQHPFTGKYFNHRTAGIQIIYQYKFDTKVNNRRVKGMLDCLIVNHNAKLIIPIDLKTGEEAGIHFPQLVLGYRYYIQGALYREALKSIVDIDFDLTGYTVKEFEFVYLSKMNIGKPLIFIMPEELHQAALNGFEDRYGNEHRGVYELIEDYYDCVENGFCDYISDVTLNKGRIIMDNLIRK